MTDSMVDAASRAAPENTEITGWTNSSGPLSIQGPEDGALALPGLLSLLPDAKKAAVDAVIVGCFDDVGLEQMRASAHCPVIGVGQAAYHLAVLTGPKFSVLTSVKQAIPVIKGNIRRQGFETAARTIKACGIDPVELEIGSSETLARVTNEIDALAEEGVNSVILGCAGMSRHAHSLQRYTQLPLIDGVVAAALLARAVTEGREKLF